VSRAVQIYLHRLFYAIKRIDKLAETGNHQRMNTARLHTMIRRMSVLPVWQHIQWLGICCKK
jgi:hypothetical protein